MHSMDTNTPPSEDVNKNGSTEIPSIEQFVEELSSPFADLNIATPLVSKKETNHVKTTATGRGSNYNEWAMERNKALILRLLDSTSVDDGLTEDAKSEMSSFFENENAYDVLADCIVSPDKNPSLCTESKNDDASDNNIHIKRSYRAMKILVKDIQLAANLQRAGADIDNSGRFLLLNATRANLLAKKLFAAYETKRKSSGELSPHIPHVNHLLESLLDVYASSVVSAACVGGKDGIASSLGSMLSLHRGGLKDNMKDTSGLVSSPLPALTTLVTRGCTGRRTQGSTVQQSGLNATSNDLVVSKGQKRKFVRSLADWRFLLKLTECIIMEPEIGTDATVTLFRVEGACDSLLAVVDCFGYQPPTPGVTEGKKGGASSDIEESMGEELLLSPLGENEIVRMLASCAANGRVCAATTASRALLGMFDLATGRSKNKSAPPTTDATDDDEVAAKAAKAQEDASAESKMNNKLKKSGITRKMHDMLVSNIAVIVKGLGIHSSSFYSPKSENGNSRDQSNEDVVRHPGRCIIEKPFTTRRLNLVTLLADILSYQDDSNNDLNTQETYEPESRKGAIAAMDELMKLPLPPLPLVQHKAKERDADGQGNNDSADTIENPWPGLCELLFAYPENNLYHVQFYRLLHAVCMANHEASLKLIVQRSKFVSRAISTYNASSSNIGASPSASHRGVMLRCLNALRLHSQSLPPSTFLRHYLDSHDGWKAFQDSLNSATVEQQLPGGGIPRRTNTTLLPSDLQPDTSFDVDIDLGSAFASELGFDGIKKFVDEDTNSPMSGAVASPSNSISSSLKKKKKKKKKSKKKKKDVGDSQDITSTADEGEGEDEEDDD